MSKQSKRDLVRAYKERKTPRGVFAIRCIASGQCWVSASPNLDGQQNSSFFGLRLGSHPNKALQAAWAAHGEAGFTFEILETLSDEERSDYALKSDLKTMETAWRGKLCASAVTG